jgi:predicted ferric reductase
MATHRLGAWVRPQMRPGWTGDGSRLAAFMALIAAAWLGALWATGLPEGDALWVLRGEALNLTGLWAIGLMSLAMVLSTRPAWLEGPLGGLDRIYRLHRRAGILAGLFALAHWLVEMADDPIKALVGRAGRPAREHGSVLFEGMRSVGKDLGEWAIYALLALIVISLVRRFPFRPWRWMHRVMPVLYLMLAFHAAALAPPAWWAQPVGALSALMLAAGTGAALVSLLGRIGARRQVAGQVVTVDSPAPDLTEVTCRMGERWPGHRAGQFALVTLHPEEGAHPFTIAAADHGDGLLRFDIKALGDYTRGLAARLRPGQPVRVEGPYGRFTFRPSRSRRRRQVWIAGGVGVTPFIAALEALARGEAQDGPPADARIELHYATRRAEGDPFVTRLEALCTGLPKLRLSVHDGARGALLSVDGLEDLPGLGREGEIWFCGPAGFAQALRAQLRERGLGRVPFHQEAFEFR